MYDSEINPKCRHKWKLTIVNTGETVYSLVNMNENTVPL